MHRHIKKIEMMYQMASEYHILYEDIINECLYYYDEEKLENISLAKIPKLIEILLENKKRAWNWYEAVEKIRSAELVELGVHEYCDSRTCQRCKKFVEDNYTKKEN